VSPIPGGPEGVDYWRIPPPNQAYSRSKYSMSLPCWSLPAAVPLPPKPRGHRGCVPFKSVRVPGGSAPWQGSALPSHPGSRCVHMQLRMMGYHENCLPFPTPAFAVAFPGPTEGLQGSQPPSGFSPLESVHCIAYRRSYSLRRQQAAYNLLAGCQQNSFSCGCRCVMRERLPAGVFLTPPPRSPPLQTAPPTPRNAFVHT